GNPDGETTGVEATGQRVARIESELDRERQQWDEGQLQGYGEQPDERQEDPVAAPEFHPGKGIGGEGGNRGRDERGGDGDHEAVEGAGSEGAGPDRGGLGV